MTNLKTVGELSQDVPCITVLEILSILGDDKINTVQGRNPRPDDGLSIVFASTQRPGHLKCPLSISPREAV